MNRPIGISLVSGMVVLSGAVGLLASLGIRSALGPVIAVLSVLLFLGGYGLWTLEAWGWALVSGLYAVSILVNVLTFETIDVADTFRLVVYVVILAYLYRRRDIYLSDERPREKPKGKSRGEYKDRQG